MAFDLEGRFMHTRGVTLPRRARRYGVGKEIAGAIYLHRAYEGLLGGALEEAKRQVPSNFDYSVVKYQPGSGVVSFIRSSTFDTLPEPLIETVLTVHPDGRVVLRQPPADPWIYHHKWLMVGDDYSGFDVEQSKRRSARWLSLDGVDKRRIGKSSYWEREIAPRLST